MSSSDKKTILSLNLNGSSELKIAQLKTIAQERNAYCILIQEFKAKDLPTGILAAFPPEKWYYGFTPFEVSISQGLLSLIRIHKDIEVLVQDESEKGLLLHKILISTEATLQFSIGNIYAKPSLNLDTPHLKTLFEDFVSSVAFFYGDYNLNVPGRAAILEEVLEKHNRIQLVDFPTFKKAGQQFRCENLTDIIVSKPCFTHEIVDTNIFLGDHVLMQDQIHLKIMKDSEPPKPNNAKDRHFYLDPTKISTTVRHKHWAELPTTPTLGDIISLTNKLKAVCRSRKKPFLHQVGLEYFEEWSGGDGNEENLPLTKFWSTVCQEISSLYDVGSVFRTIKTFSTGEEIATTAPKPFPRNQKKKALDKYKGRVGKITHLSHDMNLKYLRIMRSAASHYRKSPPTFRFTDHQVLTELKKLNSQAKNGPDNFLSCFFPVLDDSVGIKKLANFINYTVFHKPEGIFLPSYLKNADLHFIPKSESTGETRPLLLNSRLLALIDRLVNSLVLKFIDQSERFRNRHAFRPFRGVENAFDDIINFIQDAKESGEDVVLFQGDLSSAYNGCHHRLIIIRIYELMVETGNRSGEDLWILLYLKSWSSRWVFFEKTSFKLVTGVPQGSPLSPSIFSVVFCWDYTGNKAVMIVFYADDFSSLTRGKEWDKINQLLNEVLLDLEGWCLKNDFQLNPSKSKILILGSTQAQNKLKLQSRFEKIEKVRQIRVLGLTFDSSFTFEAQFRKVEKYMRTRINALNKLRLLGLSDRCLRAAALGLRCKIMFGLFHFTVMSRSMLERFEKIWIQTCRAWMGASQLVPIETLFEQSGTCKLENFINYLLMSRYAKGTALLTEDCFQPTSPLSTMLPKSPRQPIRSSNRQSTIDQTEASLINYEKWKNDKSLRKSERFLSEISDREKEIFKEVTENSEPNRVKLKLKKALKISFSVDISKRKRIFESLKREKIEKFKLIGHTGEGV